MLIKDSKISLFGPILGTVRILLKNELRHFDEFIEP